MTRRIKRVFQFSVLFMGALILLVAPLVHIDFPVRNQNVETYRDSLSVPVLDLKSKIAELRTSFDNGNITAENYIFQNDQLQLMLDNLLDKNDKLIDVKIDQERLYGWPTTRKFLIGLGIRLPYLFFSLTISWLIALLTTRDKHLKIAFRYLQIACYTMTFYQLIWCFWYVQDYPLETYWYAMIAFCGMAAIGCTYLFKYVRTKDILIAHMKGNFLNFIVEIRNIHYKKLLVRAIKKDLYNQTYQEELKNDTKEFESRLHDKAEEFID